MSKPRRRKNAPFEFHLKKGKENIKKKKFSDALEDFTKAIELNPKCAEAYFERGRTNELLEKAENALEDYDKVIELDSSFSHAYIHRSFLYSELGKPEQALKDMKKAHELDSSGESAYYCNLGNIYGRDLEQYQQALECYDKALELKPAKALQSAIYINRGNIYLALKKYDKALEDYENSAKLNPNDVLVHLNRGLAHREMRQFGRALEAFGCAAELQPEDIEIHFQLALTYEELKQFDKALEEYDRILAFDPKHAHAHTHIGIIYGNFGEIEESNRHLSEAIKLNPKEDVAFFNRAEGHIEMGNYDLALKDFERAIELDPHDAFAYFGKGKVLCYLGDAEMSFKERKTYERKVNDCFKKVLQITKDSRLKKLVKWWVKFFRKYCDASPENKKRLKIFAEVYENTLFSNLFSTIFEQQNRVNNFMSLNKTFVDSECFLAILRRWNSFTPIVPGKFRSNLGGGYFLACDGQGTVIDPGYNFIENFMENDFSLGDIHNIVMTHAHDDHTADFEAILSLFSKSENNGKISLFSNLGASVKFGHLVSKNESIIKRIEVLNENDTYQMSPNLQMTAIRAMHKDILTETSSKGLLFELKRGSRKYKLGITGDTMLFSNGGNEKDLCSFFENTDVLILHLGSIHSKELEYTQDNFEVHRYDGEHLGIRGIVNLIFQCRPKIAIISEFGEELRELRSRIAHDLDNNFENYDSSGNVRVIPSDIGLKVIFGDAIRIRCEVCEAMIEPKDVRYTETLINNKIAYHCYNHKRVEVIEKFRKEEEQELRIRAESMGCKIDLISPRSHLAIFQHERKT